MKTKRLVIALLIAVLWTWSIAAQSVINDLKPTIILISLDGFRYDYLDKYSPPTLNALAREGVRARWMIPAYPTKTFPNHYTIVTGLYPDNHGLIENNMYDAEMRRVFGLDKREEVTNPAWWGGEPIWVTAQKQGQIAGAFFWPGTETAIGGMMPTFWKPYEHNLPNETRVDTVLSWLDLPREKRPTMITMYFADVDDAGHASGPDGDLTRAAVAKVDGDIRRLVNGLRARKIDRKVNLVIVSDHGMAEYRMRDAVVLDEMFDPADAERIFWVGEFTQIFPKPGREDAIYNSIKSKLPTSAQIFRREEFPARFKFGRNKRIAPIVVIPNEGSIITNKERYARAVREGTLDRVRGGHGYDNALTSMRATFIAHGGKFRRGLVVEPFESVDVYNLLCRVLGLTPAKNDGNPDRVKGVLK